MELVNIFTSALLKYSGLAIHGRWNFPLDDLDVSVRSVGSFFRGLITPKPIFLCHSNGVKNGTESFILAALFCKSECHESGEKFIVFTVQLI